MSVCLYARRCRWFATFPVTSARGQRGDFPKAERQRAVYQTHYMHERSGSRTGRGGRRPLTATTCPYCRRHAPPRGVAASVTGLPPLPESSQPAMQAAVSSASAWSAGEHGITGQRARAISIASAEGRTSTAAPAPSDSIGVAPTNTASRWRRRTRARSVTTGRRSRTTEVRGRPGPKGDGRIPTSLYERVVTPGVRPADTDGRPPRRIRIPSARDGLTPGGGSLYGRHIRFFPAVEERQACVKELFSGDRD